MLDFLGNGFGPSPVGVGGSSALVAFPAELYQSPLLDLTVPNLGIELIPAKPSHIPQISSTTVRWLIELRSGTQTVPVSFQAGSDAAHTNFVAPLTTNPTNTDVNTAAPPSLSSIFGVAGLTVQRFPGAPVFLDVTAGAQGTGGFSLKAKFIVVVRWQAVK